LLWSFELGEGYPRGICAKVALAITLVDWVVSGVFLADVLIYFGLTCLQSLYQSQHLGQFHRGG